MRFFMILGLTYIVVMLAIWHRPLFDTFKAHTDRQIRPVTQLVLEMLERPEGWSFDGYRAKHATGAAIWIATRPEAAALSLDGDVSPHGSYNAGKPVVETNLRERRKLYAAAIALRNRNAAEEHRAKVAEWANRVETYADNVVKLGGKS